VRNGFSDVISAGLMGGNEANALVDASGCSWGEKVLGVCVCERE
jgi:hypothetical protein